LRLQIARTPNGITLSWTGSGALLESATSITGPWTTNGLSQANPQQVVPTANQRFFRLRQE
jgi:hypothetical protein